MTPIAACARIPNPFECLSEICLRTHHGRLFHRRVEVAETVPRIMCVACWVLWEKEVTLAGRD
jgi:hypothetical protein